MNRDRPKARDHAGASTDADDDDGTDRRATDVSRRRLLGAAGTVAVAGLAGCSGILGGGGGGGSSGSGPDNVQNEVDGIEVTDATAESSGGRYSIMVTLRNTGGEDTSVLDFGYDVTLYDSSGSEIETMGTAAANRDGFYDGNPGKVEIIPQMQSEASAVDSFELTIRCEEGPYCQ
ncbi:hypothetical protein L593_07730 [Salinarchaeum sp. Harcht-Bsk1]|uniref:hypothetical protein n=1 Tax=Salinarchaeum sp. Harcht-Bsk1 TaxID=1333523 RepID=UPI0003423327|nr:hypothetical protein [Salinarchaeum sp. Harcht-Bsk1]AGN01491.1 hypothetical protein L593_07730 [Salinarchaeum sp. Harcht-Bsk1]